MCLSHTLLKPHNSTTGEFIDKRWTESSHYTTKHSYIRFKGTWFPLEHHHNENARGNRNGGTTFKRVYTKTMAVVVLRRTSSESIERERETSPPSLLSKISSDAKNQLTNQAQSSQTHTQTYLRDCEEEHRERTFEELTKNGLFDKKNDKS